MPVQFKTLANYGNIHVAGFASVSSLSSSFSVGTHQVLPITHLLTLVDGLPYFLPLPHQACRKILHQLVLLHGWFS